MAIGISLAALRNALKTPVQRLENSVERFFAALQNARKTPRVNRLLGWLTYVSCTLSPREPETWRE